MAFDFLDLLTVFIGGTIFGLLIAIAIRSLAPKREAERSP